jgi:hypothetical protein
MRRFTQQIELIKFARDTIGERTNSLKISNNVFKDLLHPFLLYSIVLQLLTSLELCIAVVPIAMLPQPSNLFHI